jgi:hypothetical protein
MHLDFPEMQVFRCWSPLSPGGRLTRAIAPDGFKRYESGGICFHERSLAPLTSWMNCLQHRQDGAFPAGGGRPLQLSGRDVSALHELNGLLPPAQPCCARKRGGGVRVGCVSVICQ